MPNRQYFEAKFLVDSKTLEQVMGKRLPDQVDKLNSKLQKTTFGQAFRQAGKDAQAFHNRLGEAGRRISDTGKTMTIASAGIILFGRQAIKAASDLNETQSKVRVVFGQSADAVLKFGKTAATSIGQSEQQAEEAAATLGNLFVSMKIGQPAAAQMSTTMVRLAGDLASFNNASPEETLTALRAGLVGETEPLRRFGVNLNDATLRAEALRLGLGPIGPTLSTQQRTLAAYSLILQQTKTAQGDFARTSGGLANQQRIMAAEFKDASAALGKDFLPVALTLVNVARKDLIPVVSKAADFFAKLPKPIQEIGVAALIAAGPLTFLAGKIATGVSAVLKARDAWAAYRIAKVAQAAVDTELAAAETGLAAATTSAGAAAAGASGAIGRGGMADATGSMFRQGVAAIPVLGALAGGFALSMKAAEDNVSTFDELRHALGFHVKALDDANAKQAEATQKTNQYTQAITDSYPELDIRTAKQIASTAATQDAAMQMAAHTQAVKANQQAMQDAQKQLDTYKQQFAQQRDQIAQTVEAYDGLISKSKTSATSIIGDLQTQTANYRTYAADVQTLIRKGVGQDALGWLEQKGPEYVHGLAVGTNAKLAEFKKAWTDRMAAIKGDFNKSLQAQYADLVTKIGQMNQEVARLRGELLQLKIQASITYDKYATGVLRAFPPKKGFRLLAEGGRLPGYGGGDRIPAMLEAGETIIPKDKTKQPAFQMWAKQQGIPGFARGGLIGGDAALGKVRTAVNATNYMRDVLDDAIAGSVTRALMASIGQVKLPGAAARPPSGTIQQWAMQLLAAHGWASQWAAFSALEMAEAGWNPRARNPSSGALGLAQALGHGGSGTGGALGNQYGGFGLTAAQARAANSGDAWWQLVWMMNYIAQRWHSPAVAWGGYHARGNWYQRGGLVMDQGGWLAPGWNPPVYNGTGRPEPVGSGSEASMARALRRALEGMILVVDDRGQGRLTARTAGILARGG